MLAKASKASIIYAVDVILINCIFELRLHLHEQNVVEKNCSEIKSTVLALVPWAALQ
jgi:hypothetical protein